jgi:1,4-dihydroxy-6-naphthoate synthase
MVVSTRRLAPDDLNSIRVAVPGTLTTAYLALKVFNPQVQTETVPFDKIIPGQPTGKPDASLVIGPRMLTSLVAPCNPKLSAIGSEGVRETAC